jgi:hypothetical protein
MGMMWDVTAEDNSMKLQCMQCISLLQPAVICRSRVSAVPLVQLQLNVHHTSSVAETARAPCPHCWSSCSHSCLCHTAGAMQEQGQLKGTTNKASTACIAAGQTRVRRSVLIRSQSCTRDKGLNVRVRGRLSWAGAGCKPVFE